MRNIHVSFLEALLRKEGLKPLKEILIMSSTYQMRELHHSRENKNIPANHSN